MPDIDKGPGFQDRHDLFTDSQVKIRIAEFFGVIDAQVFRRLAAKSGGVSNLSCIAVILSQRASRYR